MCELVTFAVTNLLQLRFLHGVKYRSTSHDPWSTWTDFCFILFLSGCFTTLPPTILKSLRILIFLYVWLDALLYRLFSVGLGVSSPKLILASARHEGLSVHRIQNFLKYDLSSAVLSLLPICFDWFYISNSIRSLCVLIVCHSVANSRPTKICDWIGGFFYRHEEPERDTCLESNRTHSEVPVRTPTLHSSAMSDLTVTSNWSKRNILVIFPGTLDQDMLTCSNLKSRYKFIIVDENDFWEFPNSNGARAPTDIHYALCSIIDKYHGRIDGVIGTGELPSHLFSSYIGTALGLHNPLLRDILRISHKYYSRQFQQTIVPNAVPAFALIPPSVKFKPASLHYPFFVKPVKACTSMFARVVHDDNELREATTFPMKDRVNNMTWYEALDQLIDYCFESLTIPSLQFIGEGLLDGAQVTLDGFIQNGQVTIMGITDSIMYPNTRLSFQRFEYPSSLPVSVQTRMAELSSRVIGASNLNHTCFNIEFFYNETNDSISIIEINTRMSYQFSDLFYWVDGQSSFAVQLQLAIGEKVQWISRQGSYQVAASFVMRRLSDAYVLQAPTREERDLVYHTFAAINLKILCEKGQRLSAIRQDMNSYRYAIANMAAQSADELHENYALVKRMLTFTFDDI